MNDSLSRNVRHFMTLGVPVLDPFRALTASINGTSFLLR